jgi:dTDP-4-dehydrorhamnose reductase
VRLSRIQLLRKAPIMSSRSPDLVKRMKDVVDEIIPTMPVDDRTSALITHIARCVLEAAEQQDNYMTLLAVASAESSAISTMEDIMEVLKLCIAQGAQACNLGVPILAEEIAAVLEAVARP